MFIKEDSNMLASLRHRAGGGGAVFRSICIRWFQVEGIVRDLFRFNYGKITTEHGTCLGVSS